MGKLDILRYLAIEYWFIGLICSRKDVWCNFWELARVSRSGTHIEAMRVSRERLSLSQQVSGFIPMTCIWYVCFYMHQLYESYVYLVILHGKSWLHGTILLAYWYLCMGLGCRPDSVVVIPQGQWWNNVRIILPDVPRFFLGFRVGLVGQGSYTRADNCSCYLHHAFIYIYCLWNLTRSLSSNGLCPWNV